MPKGLQTPFQTGHELDYVFKVTERHPQSSAALADSCRFCLKFWCEPRPDAKRNRTNNVQLYEVPFRTDMYKKHHFNASPEKWRQYLACSAEQKVVFFGCLVNYAITLMAHFESKCALTPTFNRDIVEGIIGDLHFDPNVEVPQSTFERAFAVFEIA